MSEALQKKLRLTTGTAIRTVHDPPTCQDLGALPKGATSTKGIRRTADQAFIHLFGKNRTDRTKVKRNELA